MKKSQNIRNRPYMIMKMILCTLISFSQNLREINSIMYLDSMRKVVGSNQGWSQTGIRSKFVRFDSKICDSIDSKRQKKFEKFDNFQFEIRSIRKKKIRKIRKYFKFNFSIRKIRNFVPSKQDSLLYNFNFCFPGEVVLAILAVFKARKCFQTQFVWLLIIKSDPFFLKHKLYVKSVLEYQKLQKGPF